MGSVRMIWSLLICEIVTRQGYMQAAPPHSTEENRGQLQEALKICHLLPTFSYQDVPPTYTSPAEFCDASWGQQAKASAGIVSHRED
ncbi:hypothetical protein LEMLEM_LOCUS79 [Lemmus lemmus]